MSADCKLCGQPAGESADFCCAGCMNVYAILEESGIVASGADFRESEIYRESLRLGLISTAAKEPRPSIPPDAEVREALYHVEGMWCASCGWLIEHALTREHGVVSAEVMFASDLLRVRYCPQYVPPGRIPERIGRLGYRAAEQRAGSERDQSERRDLLLRAGVAGFLWLNVMTLSLVIYASYWEAISDTARRVVPLVLMALATPAVFYSGWPVLRAAALGLRARTLRMEALLSLGILAAYGYSAGQAFRGGRHYYFDTACAIVTLVLLGKLLERGAKEKTANAIALLYRMMPRKARVVEGGRERFVAVEALEPGARFLVKAGERIPADGVVAEGTSHVDESLLTGESAPVGKGPGSKVAGGSLNAGGVLEVAATRAAGESTLGQIIRSVEAAMSSRSRIERVVDRVSRAFVPAVIGVAGLTFAGCLAAGVATAEALMRAIAVLVIACPCALGIATPLAITAAVGAASRRGVLVRDSRVLEIIGGIDVVLLDKTGTVTEGEFGVVESAGERGELALVAAVEAYSEHPLGRAVARHASACAGGAREVEVHRGMGIAGTVNGVRVCAGNRRMVGDVEPSLEALAAQWERQGRTVAFYAFDGAVRGAVALGDRVRPGAAELVSQLRARGIRTVLISGDAEATTAAVAGEIGADEYMAGVLPEEKQAAVAAYQARGSKVAMVGDGVNDAPALAAADLGIALGCGTDLAMQAAPVVLMSSSLGRMLDVFEISRATLRVVRQNLFWAFFYNAAGITLAITGLLDPILAAGAMVLSSLSVTGNSLRLRRAAGL